MNTNRFTIELFWAQIRKYKFSFFTALICIPLSVLLSNTLLPFLFSQVIGALTNLNENLVWNNIALAAIIGISAVILNAIGYQSLIRHEAKVRASLSDDTFKTLIQKDMRFFANEKVGALTSRYIDFIRSHLTLQDLLIMKTLGFVISLSVGLIIVVSKSWILAVMIIILVVLLIVQIKWSTRHRAAWRHERKTLNGEINGNVADTINNNIEVKTFAGEELEIKNISDKNNHYKELYIKDIGFMSGEGSVRWAIMTLVQVATVGLCSFFILKKQIDIASIVFVISYLQQISSQIFSLSDMLNGYDQALLEAAPMSDILAKENLINDKPGAISINNIEPTIDMINISYRYSNSTEDVLHDFNLSVPAGQKIGLIGQSGSGKTTITHLLLRFMDATKGSINIGGYDIRDVTQKSLRDLISYVPQESILFHRSLRDNITYGKPNATDEEITKTIKQANADEFINKLPDGLNTLVGERGIKLSGGQRQRIAIARAILKNAPILILDEATSALDSESEGLIQEALIKLMKGRTSIVIAHRLSTIARLDRIIVLDDGKIAEQGTHTELLEKNGIYAKLWSHQSGGFIKE